MDVEEDEFEDVKMTIREIVLMFRVMWDEVEKQFSDLPREERRIIFSSIASHIIDMFTAFAGEEVKPEARGRRKRGK
ncbi:hypothetical protein KEJ34_06545 [Candidatus Bathyarchaeota archaeon]|nr:hypothetical protein [Candidatus Bathyarchaeota archaeon]